MLGELIGEFKGRNTAYRVLPDGKMEASAQGTGKILGMMLCGEYCRCGFAKRGFRGRRKRYNPNDGRRHSHDEEYRDKLAGGW